MSDPPVTFTLDHDNRVEDGGLTATLAALLVGLHSRQKDTNASSPAAATAEGALISLPQETKESML